MAVYKFYDGTNWVELAKKSDIPSLSGYATETWVGNNYIPITGASGIGALTPTGNGTTDFGGSSNRWHYGYFRRLLAIESISNGTSYDSNNMITVPTGAGTFITDFNIGSYAITSLDSCIRTSSSGMQLITCTGTDTPLRLKGSTGDTYLEFMNSSGSTLGYLVVLGTHKPSFYYNGNHEIALVENVVNLSSSNVYGQTIVATNTNVPLSVKGSSSGSCVIGFYNNAGSELGFIGAKSGNIPYFYNPSTGADHNIILDSDLGDQVIFSLSGTQLTITRK